MSKHSSVKPQIDKLGAAINKQLASHGEANCSDVHDVALPLLEWIDHLRVSEVTGVCNEFLDGLKAAIVETAGAISIGFVRSAIFSIRGQVDLALGWLYFKDHPIEWASVEAYGEGFMLKRDVVAYLEYYVPGFKSRFAILSAAKGRTEADPYKVLSAHVHSQSTLVMPAYTQFDTLVMTNKKCRECIRLQAEVTEYLNDIFLSVFAPKWAALPKRIVDMARARLGAAKAKRIFG